MCGIAVTIDLPHVVATSQKRIGALQLTEQMVDRLRPRGPDNASILRIGSAAQAVPGEPEVIIGHTRLAIVGGTEVKAPLVWSNEENGTKMALVHNGETYNYVELKKQLIEEGYCAPDCFKTECDSEVLLACCATRGVEWTLRQIRGMFAFVLVEWCDGNACTKNDHSSFAIQRIVAARDVFGIKPLCCAVDCTKSRIVLASQISAIPPTGFKDGVTVKDILPGCHVEHSFHKDHSKWTYTERTHSFVSSGFDPRYTLPSHRIEGLSDSRSYKNKIDLDVLREKLIDAVECRIPPIGSVKTAVLLSGGLDSSLITSISARLAGNEKLHTFNISYKDAVGTDQEYARQVRDHLRNVHHEEVTFSFQEGLEVLPKVIECLETYDAVSVRAGVPLYLLSRHIKSLGFKVILCGEGADEVFAGYRLFEVYQPWNREEVKAFGTELCRRLENIDTSELQRVDRCTSAHGLEARVPFLDPAFVSTAMQFKTVEKMSHISLGRIQKYILRLAFKAERKDSREPHHGRSGIWLPESVLFREKEQLADGIGREWIESIQKYAMKSEGIQEGEDAEKALYRRIFEQGEGSPSSLVSSSVRLSLVRERQQRRQQGWPMTSNVRTGIPQPRRWHAVSNDADLNSMSLSDDDVRHFLAAVLGWSSDLCIPTLDTLNRLIVSMLERVPFHNLTLLLRKRRPPTIEEIKADMVSGLGGPCSVINTFFAVLLVKLGFGSNVYLLSCHINGRDDCHVALLVQIEGLRYFVDVANAKPYTKALHLADASVQKSLNDSFEWSLSFNASTRRMELMHFGKMALSFNPTVTARFRSFRDMIKKSRSDPSFGPFLTGLRFCIFSSKASAIKAVRDVHIYDGKSTKDKMCVSTKDAIRRFAEKNFHHIDGFPSLVTEALKILDRESPGWFDRSITSEAAKSTDSS